MSTENGVSKVMDDALRDAKALVEAAAVEEAEQLDLLQPSTEDLVEARELLGPAAGRMAVVREARRLQRGRPKGARNKRTDDFARYLLSFGQHPAVTMMQIQSTPPELLIEASQQEKVHSFSKNGEPRVVIERMTYSEAQSLRIRCAEGLMPYLESKKPVAVDATIRGVIVNEQIGEIKPVKGQVIDGDVLGVAMPEEDER